MDREAVRLLGIGDHGTFGADDGTNVVSQQTIDFGTRSTVLEEVYNLDQLLCNPRDPVALQPLQIPRVLLVFDHWKGLHPPPPPRLPNRSLRYLEKGGIRRGQMLPHAGGNCSCEAARHIEQHR